MLFMLTMVLIFGMRNTCQASSQSRMTCQFAVNYA